MHIPKHLSGSGTHGRNNVITKYLRKSAKNSIGDYCKIIFGGLQTSFNTLWYSIKQFFSFYKFADSLVQFSFVIVLDDNFHSQINEKKLKNVVLIIGSQIFEFLINLINLIVLEQADFLSYDLFIRIYQYLFLLFILVELLVDLLVLQQLL